MKIERAVGSCESTFIDARSAKGTCCDPLSLPRSTTRSVMNKSRTVRKTYEIDFISPKLYL